MGTPGSAQLHENRKCHLVPYNANYEPYEELLTRRRREASRSIVVQVQSANSYSELFAYCKQFGAVNEMHHYMVQNNSHFFLVEFNEAESAKVALGSATHINLDEVIPVQSPMLWFRNTRSLTKVTSNSADLKDATQQLTTVNGSGIPSNDDITNRLLAAESISEQMILLHDTFKLDEVGIRLRFLTAHQLERNFVGSFPHIAVFPFGSSVNGFGKRGCDLDLVLNLVHNKIENPSSRFVFHAKMISNGSKMQSKKLMEIIADSIQYLIPGVANVRRILQARVPIIKYDQTLTGLECDLSMTNMAAVHMSELLCLYGEVDWRVRPLVFTIRHWAKCVGLTNVSPGRWITNFSITLLVIFYLQQNRILPTLNQLRDLAGKADIRLADHSVDCTFLRDVTKMPPPEANANTDSLETLLRGFFEFYAIFDFPGRAISLREGKSTFKPDSSAMYVCNPLEVELNVTKNVSVEETERLRTAFRNASWMMELVTEQKYRQRGVLSIFEQKLDIVSYVEGRRIVNVAALFKIPKEKNMSSGSKKSQVARVVENSAESEDNRNSRMKKGRVRRR